MVQSPIGIKSRCYAALLFGLFHGVSLTLAIPLHFYPFRNSIQLYNFILHLHMDPGGKIYTIDEFRCWKVENLDDERPDENKNEGGGYRVVSPHLIAII